MMVAYSAGGQRFRLGCNGIAVQGAVMSGMTITTISLRCCPQASSAIWKSAVKTASLANFSGQSPYNTDCERQLDDAL